MFYEEKRYFIVAESDMEKKFKLCYFCLSCVDVVRRSWLAATC